MELSSHKDVYQQTLSQVSTISHFPHLNMGGFSNPLFHLPHLSVQPLQSWLQFSSGCALMAAACNHFCVNGSLNSVGTPSLHSRRFPTFHFNTSSMLRWADGRLLCGADNGLLGPWACDPRWVLAISSATTATSNGNYIYTYMHLYLQWYSAFSTKTSYFNVPVSKRKQNDFHRLAAGP